MLLPQQKSLSQAQRQSLALNRRSAPVVVPTGIRFERKSAPRTPCVSPPTSHASAATLSGQRGEALRLLLYLFECDEAVRLFRAAWGIASAIEVLIGERSRWISGLLLMAAVPLFRTVQAGIPYRTCRLPGVGETIHLRPSSFFHEGE